MSSDYQHKSHNKHLLQVHLIFAVKYRKALLQGNIAEDVKQIIFDLCTANGWLIITQETDKDRCAILFSAKKYIFICLLATTQLPL